jgi:hypothetical protein
VEGKAVNSHFRFYTAYGQCKIEYKWTLAVSAYFTFSLNSWFIPHVSFGAWYLLGIDPLALSRSDFGEHLLRTRRYFKGQTGKAPVPAIPYID